MADSLSLEVLAEGVEEQPQVDFLLSHGCTHCQGFLYSRPKPAAEIRALLEAGENGEAATVAVESSAVQESQLQTDQVLDSIDRAVAGLRRSQALGLAL